jgi:hypothetical protein
MGRTDLLPAAGEARHRLESDYTRRRGRRTGEEAGEDQRDRPNKFLGHDKPKRPLAHLVPLIAIAAQAYHGGYNVAAALGFSPEEKELADCASGCPLLVIAADEARWPLGASKPLSSSRL